MDWYSDPNATKPGDKWSQQDLKQLKKKLITANHILHHHGVVDAYGHISVRHPQDASIYIMCGYMAPGVVSRPEDLIEYRVEDSFPVDPEAKKGYSERFIHGEMFRMYESVNCVVHSHAQDVLPYATSEVPLMPVFHMAGFLGKKVPVFDIATLYQPGEAQDLLVRNACLGTELASKFTSPGVVLPDSADKIVKTDHTVVLMRRHGYTTHGPDIETAVYRAIYTKANASVQTNSLLIQQAWSQGSSLGGLTPVLQPLTEEMCDGCDRMNTGTQDKPWRLWVAEVENLPLYVNMG
ncbi:class II aldolase and Adducin N-terminal domain-containing protein [Pseudomassariella vexata]|uniref:Class II aldolase and Adducin N-terminal domain-domain-containing protein n=1 Tax=Pseudomassariella vexata TaxID=1141098 RepID=A0A1Y2DAX7_9PEZI|nr:class II aldolase and Adducin N-terminal domain-containing protein [Pseudomassariella vexata]ORY56347.1 class II aldolase and Adducin N-terminal domain-domain-containing protein [Pseudomassariella vexata]